ncbi:FAD-dependent oxidoreductase [Cellulomonas shaoxiangyii]|uniref:FAD-dependent oxidoreductase n=2 Tax=Cellulomonas shaoxiangyii TaxID=2566013 RepID=A0A4P7SHS3_9CELL|nr:FAD-dependent oxidoreductase [Cellulomonas shaoxiangyii]QCB92676.1 FAD-dependent oxidoreductase [Cellulomonas shaoxiangyii]TGY83427.1 FAD-dependent oxidoreductase [Cellulomonas shaoxiangyii]
MSTEPMSTGPLHDLVVVGAGPAGMAAALAARGRGLDVVVVDEQQRPGGQVFRRPHGGVATARHTWPAGYPWGPGLVADATASDVSWRWDTTALGVLRDEPGAPVRLAVSGPDGTATLRARRLLVATGAYDMPVALPGWTLPGVVTAGAAQGLLKSQRVLVGHRPVLAGAHPLLLLVADQLVAAGAHVAEVALARGLPGPAEALRALPAVPGHTGLLASSTAALGRLLRAGVRVRTRTVPTRVLGTDRVEGVELCRVDAAWRPVGRGRTVEADALVLGFGFHGSTELARQAGCATRWDDAGGGWVVTHDGDQRTSVPDVLVAGEPAGVRGAEQARAEGHLAGLVTACDLRGTSPADGPALRRARRDVARARRFSDVVQRTFAPDRAALASLATPGTLVCRCESVTRATVEETLAANPHVSTANAVKLECRTGMGTCQGRYCEATVGALVAARTGRPMEQVGPFTAHLPVKPVPLGDLAGLA